MEKISNLVMNIPLEDLNIEAVLDRGFLGGGEFASQIHAHGYYEVIIQTAGNFTVDLADGTQLLMGDGAICLIPPGCHHSICPGKDLPQKLAVRFHCARRLKQPDAVPLYKMFSTALEGCKVPFLLKNQVALRQKAVALQEEFGIGGIAGRTFLQTLLTQFFILLIRDLCRDIPSDTPVAVSRELDIRRLRIEEYMNDNYTRQITQDDLAKYMNLSRRQLSRVLEATFSTSFRQLLIQLRMNRAAQLLRQTELPVEEIAYAVGYTSLSGFCDGFRKIYGISCGTYRDQF